MTYVNITALTFPEGAQAEIEKRFAARKRGVDASQGLHEDDKRRGMSVEVLGFEVVQHEE